MIWYFHPSKMIPSSYREVSFYSIGVISELQECSKTASKCSSLRRFARLLKFQSFYRKSGQMEKTGKVWQILAVGSSQNVFFYRVKNYSRPGLHERGCISRRGGAFLGGCIFARGCTPEGGHLHPLRKINFRDKRLCLDKLEFIELFLL